MNFIKTTLKISLVFLLSFITSCSESDSNESNVYNVPTSYNFENKSYGGQTDRLNMLAEMETYMKRANLGEAVDAATIKMMYANDGYTWTSDAFALAQPTKQLESKTFDPAPINALIDELAELSLTGNTTTSLNGEKTYLFNENGFEPIQLISKGIMGSCFYYQGTSVYLSAEKMDVANDVDALVGPLEYTAMQHHFDESFGYFGAPVSFSNSNTSGGSYWAKYATKTIEGDLTTIDNIMQDGFILGRAAIDNDDLKTIDQAIETIQAEWEMVTVCAALHYLNGAIEDITDPALRNHGLSEAIAFIDAIRYNAQGTISGSAVDNIIDMLGTNLNVVTPEMINNTRTALASAFGITNATAY